MNNQFRAHGVHVGGVSPVIPGVGGFGHGAVGIGGVPTGSIASPPNFPLGNPIIMNPYQHVPNSYQGHNIHGYQNPYLTHSHTIYPPIPTYGNPYYGAYPFY